MANPRIDDLRKKLEKEPGSRLFAQLAEELRKDGELAESIRVARQGLAQHPNYPSARMTLGRALLDSGDLEAARKEFETVLKGAADNILASRYLGECLEGLGDAAAALARYRATLALAPGDKQVAARIQDLEAASAPIARAAVVGSAAQSAAPPEPEPEPEPPPIRVAEVDGPMELVTRYEEAAPPAAAPADDIFFAEPDDVSGAEVTPEPEPSERPVPLVPVDDMEFELERSYDPSPPAATRVTEPPEPLIEPDEPVLEAEPLEPEPALPEPAAGPPPVPAPSGAEAEPLLLEPEVMDVEFDLPPTPAAGTPRVTFRDILADTQANPDAPASPPPPPPAAPAPPAPEPELASPTLAELYFSQGFPEKAAEVYRRLLQREPGNDRFRARLGEIEAARAPSASPPAPATPPSAPPAAGSREEAIGRVIERLQELRSALVKGD